MACCGYEKKEGDDAVTENKKSVKQEDGSYISAARSCTDWPCCIIFIAFQVFWVILIVKSAPNGDANKLYVPRDFAGGYCGASKNWNAGSRYTPSLDGFSKMVMMMNVTESTDLIAKQLVCSSASEQALNAMGLSPKVMEDYLCGCCKSPCKACLGTLKVDDSTDVKGKMGELTGSPGNLFSSTGANAGSFTDIWSQATRFFINTCVTECNVVNAAIWGANEDKRSYTYEPSPDVPWQKAWNELKINAASPQGIKDQIATAFTFEALPTSICPYTSARYCVPFPGVEFSELGVGYCQFKMSEAVLQSVGKSTAGLFEDTGISSSTPSTGLAEAVGSIYATADALIITSILSFLIGLVFMVLLRFFLGCVVWLSICGVFAFLFLSGAIVLIRKSQCRGADLFASGKNMAVGASVAAVSAATAAAGDGVGVNCTNEALTGDGKDYRGCQTRTQSGRVCQNWDSQTPHAFATPNYAASTAEQKDVLKNNYCRNTIDAASIWCFTTDPGTRWEMCQPIGVITPNCPQGYAVENETYRKILELLGWVIWAFALIYLLSICCLCKQIRLAIKLNECAAIFVAQTPCIVVVPMVLALVAIIWNILWTVAVAFQLSQVPETWGSTLSFAQFSEAYGTADIPGNCTDTWPTGGVWKDLGDASNPDDPCAGANNVGNEKCWRCSPPRYAISYEFWYSWFVTLWNNCLLVSLLQCIIAGATAAWFFLPSDQKMSGPKIKVAVRNAFRYHFGSLCLGSFIIAVVMFIRSIVYYLQKQAEAQKNKIMVIVLKILGYIIWCFEKCMKFLNKNAYIQIAINGTWFCTSAKVAFFLILRNAFYFLTLAMLGWMVQWIGFLFIMVATALVGYLVLQATDPTANPVLPVTLYCAIGWVVGQLFMSVFGLAADTSLQCYLTLDEICDGNPPGDYIPAPLASLVDDTKKDAGKKPAGQE